MFNWFKKGMIARAYFSINWVVRKLAYSFLGTIVFHWPFRWGGISIVKAAICAGLVMLTLSFIKEFVESWEASVISKALGRYTTLRYHFKREGIKDLVPVLIGTSIAIAVLVAKAQGF